MTVGDKFVLSGAVLLIIWSYFFFWAGGGALGQQASVLLKGVAMKTLSLKHYQILEIDGLLGKSRIEVRDGAIRFVTSPCKGKQCIHAGEINKSGQIIACLPNGLSLVVEGGMQYDAINF